MKELTIKYSVVKAVDFSTALNNSAKAACKERSAEKLSGGVWEQTVIEIMESIDYSKYEADTSKEGIAAIREVLFAQMEASIYRVTTIPETGLDREGKTITLLNQKTGKIKFSSWDNTRRIFSYLGDIAKILAHDKGDLLYPEQFKVAARCDILQQLGKTGTALEHVNRLAGQMEGYFPKLEAHEKSDALTTITALHVEGVDPLIEASMLIARLDSIIMGANVSGKEDIKGLIFALGQRHYKTA